MSPKERELETEIRDLDEQLAATKGRRQALVDELLSLRSLVQIGDAVAWESRTRTWTGQVCAFGLHVGFKPISWRVAKYRKDGTLSETLAEVFEPRLIEEGGGE